ncbi:CAAX farnesyltransferase (FTase) subunit beta [Diaporthe eres]|uniref:CAAX farnesyltransferase (FTase) subunit beta n=1 Tax=Diaporthe eres TaxID=83184 RepID=A0ABR1NXQ3_DIAER
MIPDLFTSPPPVRDELQSATTVTQDDTVDLCLPFLSGEKNEGCNGYGVPHLDRERHIRFLHKQLGGFPAPFVAADASRPWFLFWSLNGLSLLGEDVSSYRASLIDTARSMQNDTGGFGGGNGQMSHLATTYAMVLALTLVGGESVYEVVDRRAMWKWLCALKQPNGGFQMAVGGEVDVSHWVGGCWPLIEAALAGGAAATAAGGGGYAPPLGHDQPGHKHKLPLTSRSLYSREGLIRYIMCCCQDQTKRGGLRDKPGRTSDGYHTCYVLAGLSSAQHKSELVDAGVPGVDATECDAGSTGGTMLGVGGQPYLNTSWSVTPYLDEAQIFDEQDRLVPLHPLYALPVGCVADIKRYFDAKPGF